MTWKFIQHFNIVIYPGNGVFRGLGCKDSSMSPPPFRTFLFSHPPFLKSWLSSIFYKLFIYSGLFFITNKHSIFCYPIWGEGWRKKIRALNAVKFRSPLPPLFKFLSTPLYPCILFSFNLYTVHIWNWNIFDRHHSKKETPFPGIDDFLLSPPPPRLYLTLSQVGLKRGEFHFLIVDGAACNVGPITIFLGSWLFLNCLRVPFYHRNFD